MMMLNLNEVEAVLRSVVNPERKSIALPFHWEGRACATNGRLFLRAADPENELALTFEPADFVRRLDWSRVVAPEDYLEAPREEVACGYVPCTVCSALGGTKTCPECGGRGMRECVICNHEGKCSECEGEGFVSALVTEDGAAACDCCDGTGKEENRLGVVEWGAWRFSAEMTSLLAAVPGLRIERPDPAKDDRLQTLNLTWTYGDGLVAMPRKNPADVDESDEQESEEDHG